MFSWRFLICWLIFLCKNEDKSAKFYRILARFNDMNLDMAVKGEKVEK